MFSTFLLGWPIKLHLKHSTTFQMQSSKIHSPPNKSMVGPIKYPTPGIKFYLRVFIAVKRHHDHSNSYKGKHLIGAGLQVRRFGPLSSCSMVLEYIVTWQQQDSPAHYKRICLPLPLSLSLPCCPSLCLPFSSLSMWPWPPSTSLHFSLSLPFYNKCLKTMDWTGSSHWYPPCWSNGAGFPLESQASNLLPGDLPALQPQPPAKPTCLPSKPPELARLTPPDNNLPPELSSYPFQPLGQSLPKGPHSVLSSSATYSGVWNIQE